MSGLTDEQRRRIEENKRKALLLRAARASQQAGQIPHQTLAVPSAGHGSTSAATNNNPVIRYGTQNTKYTNNYTQGSAKHKSTSLYNYATSAERPISNAKPQPGPNVSGSQSKINNNKQIEIESPTKPKFTGFAGNVKGKCVLTSLDRFEVQIGYSAPHIALFKTMETKQYDPALKRWNFDVKEYSKLYKSMIQLDPNAKVDPLPAPVVNMIKRGPVGTIKEADLSNVDKKLVETLLPFQRDGVNFGIHNKGRVLIADDMGLGKTLQALAIVSYYRDTWPLLIVVPSSVRFSWREQLLRWVPTLDPADVVVMKSGKDSFTTATVVIMSYDLMSRQAAKVQQQRYQIVIMDESHSLKNSKAARTKAAVPILKTARHVILLSGTPALSRPIELYSQISCIDKKLFPNWTEFGVRYCDGKQLAFGWDFNGSSNLEELHIILQRNIMIRRLKSEVMSQLPTKTRQIVVLDPASVTVDKAMRASDKLVSVAKGDDKKSVMFEYFNQTCEAKVPAVREYITDILERGEKVLIFAHHKHMMNSIQCHIMKKKYKFIRIDGSTNAEKRNKYVNAFQDDPEIKAAILSITAANSGINLTAASLVIFTELFWNPGILQQAEDRAHRMGQTDNVCVKYLYAHDTADDLIWPLVQKKLEVLGKAGLSKDDFSDADRTHHRNSKFKDITSYFEKEFMDELENDECLDDIELTPAATSSVNDYEIDSDDFDSDDLADIENASEEPTSKKRKLTESQHNNGSDD